MSKKTASHTVVPSAAKPKGRSIEEFRAAHDKSYMIPRRVTEALKALGNSWEYEVEFLRRAGLATVDLARVRDQFEDHIVLISGRNTKRAWCGTKVLAEQLRSMLE